MTAPRSENPFSPAILGFLVAATVAIFALSVLLNAMGPGERAPYEAQTGSPSAIGHLGFYTLLQRLDRPVSRSRVKDAVGPGRNGVLILAEPDLKLISVKEDTPLHDAENVLLVLPKWRGIPDPFHDGWVSFLSHAPESVPRDLARLLDRDAAIVRRAPQAFATNALGETPHTVADVQLLASKKLRPIIGDADGMLLAEWRGEDDERIWILADPDPLQNHGLRDPANVKFALKLVDTLRRGEGRVVFDEMVHGIVAPERNPLQLLFTFPFVIVTVEAIVAFALLLLAFTGRFGGIEVAEPAHPSGKRQLIDNIAELLERAGHAGVVLRRYCSVRLAETGRQLHAPAGLSDEALAGWLDQIARSRGAASLARATLTEADAAQGGRRLDRLAGAAQRLHDWSRNLLDGSRRRESRR